MKPQQPPIGNSALYLEKQTSVMKEMVKGEEILVVVKQCNFVLTVSSQTEILEGAEVCCELLYDFPECKPVSYINQPPIKYKALQASDRSLNIECKLNVLSSKHEDHFFRVKVTVLIGGRNLGSILSSPIRSISKLDPHKKEQMKKKKSTDQRLQIMIDEKKPKLNVMADRDEKKDKMNVMNALMAVLNQNTQYIEQIKKKQYDSDFEITSMENGLLLLIQKFKQSGRRRNLVTEAMTQLNEKELQCLREIVSVSESIPIIGNPNDRRRQEYDYPYMPRMDQMNYQNPQQFIPQQQQQYQSKQFGNPRNPFA